MIPNSSSARALAHTLCCLGFVAAGWYLWAVHRQHLGGLILYALALACPLIHLFMHRGHRHTDMPRAHAAEDGRRD